MVSLDHQCRQTRPGGPAISFSNINGVTGPPMPPWRLWRSNHNNIYNIHGVTGPPMPPRRLWWSNHNSVYTLHGVTAPMPPRRLLLTGAGLMKWAPRHHGNSCNTNDFKTKPINKCTRNRSDNKTNSNNTAMYFAYWRGFL